MRNKPNFLKRLIIAAIFSASFTIASSQTTKIDNVKKLYENNIGPILDDGEIRGYYFFYQLEKVERKVYAYELQILDQNLSNPMTKRITGSQYLFLVEGAYNQEAIFLKFYDLKTHLLTTRVFDRKANEIEKEEREASKYEKMLYSQISVKDGQQEMLFPITKTGCVNYTTVKHKKYGFTIDFHPSNDQFKKWKYSSNPDSKELQFATFIYGDEDIIINSVLKKSSMFTRKIDLEVLALNTKTGKKLFQKEIEHPKYELFVMNGLESDDEGSIYLFGTYYDKGVSEMNHPSKGLFSYKLNLKGEVIEKNFVSWASDVSKFIPVNEKGKMKEVGFLYLHDIIRDVNGNIYAIGEQYRKQISALGLTAKALGGGASASEMKIEDFMILEFNPEFELTGVNIIDKEKSIVMLPEGMGINGPQILSMYLKSQGAFDFEFVQYDKEKSLITIAYLDYVKNKGEKNNWNFGTINYLDGEASEDIVKLDPLDSKSVLKVFPGKPGNYMKMEYNSDDKTLSFTLEKINY